MESKACRGGCDVYYCSWKNNQQKCAEYDWIGLGSEAAMGFFCRWRRIPLLEMQFLFRICRAHFPTHNKSPAHTHIKHQASIKLSSRAMRDFEHAVDNELHAHADQ